MGRGSTLNIGVAPGEMNSLGFILFKYNDVLVAAVSCGAGNTCVIFENGKLFCFGQGSRGVNGQNTNTNVGDTSDTSLEKYDYIVFSTDDRAELVSVGDRHAYTNIFMENIRFFLKGNKSILHLQLEHSIFACRHCSRYFSLRSSSILY